MTKGKTMKTLSVAIALVASLAGGAQLMKRNAAHGEYPHNPQG